MDIIRKINDSIYDNKLIPYWVGINILDINADNPIINRKVYYQLKHPLFSADIFSKDKKYSLNNTLLIEIGEILDIDISQLLDNKEFVFCSIVAKPVSFYHERTSFAIRISNYDYENAFINMKKFLIQHLMISSSIIDAIYNIAYKIFKNNHFITFPISMLGINKYTKNDIPYAQLYITNNPDTTTGNINEISKESALQNALNIIETLNLNIDLHELKNLIDFAYSKNAFLSFNGIDIYRSEIKKFKLYFRCKNIMTVSDALDIFSEKISTLDKLFISYIGDIVDFIALTFIPKEKGIFIFDGIQVYQK